MKNTYKSKLTSFNLFQIYRGTDFRPAYREVSVLRSLIPPETPMAILTATANQDMVDDITTLLNLVDYKIVAAVPDRFVRLFIWTRGLDARLNLVQFIIQNSYICCTCSTTHGGQYIWNTVYFNEKGQSLLRPWLNRLIDYEWISCIKCINWHILYISLPQNVPPYKSEIYFRIWPWNMGTGHCANLAKTRSIGTTFKVQTTYL